MDLLRAAIGAASGTFVLLAGAAPAEAAVSVIGRSWGTPTWSPAAGSVAA